MSSDPHELITVHYWSDSGMHGGWCEGEGSDGFGYDTTAQVPAALLADYRAAQVAAGAAERAIEDYIDSARASGSGSRP